MTTAYHSQTAAGLTTQTVTQTEVVTRPLSVTVTDAQGRTQSVTDETGRVTTYGYDGRTTTQTLPGGWTRTTQTCLDGQLKSITGTGVVPEFHDYTVNTSGDDYYKGSITHTVWYGTGDASSDHWRKTTTNFLGQVLREEQPSPAPGGGVTVTDPFYNAKGQRVNTTRSATANQLVVCDDFGRVTKQGYDVDGNGLLEETPDGILTETAIAYEQVGGTWVERTARRVHTKTDGTGTLDTVTRRVLAEGATSWQSTTAPDGSMTVYESTTPAATHLRVSRSAPGVGTLTVLQTSENHNGLQVAQSVPIRR